MVRRLGAAGRSLPLVISLVLVPAAVPGFLRGAVAGTAVRIRELTPGVPASARLLEPEGRTIDALRRELAALERRPPRVVYRERIERRTRVVERPKPVLRDRVVKAPVAKVVERPIVRWRERVVVKKVIVPVPKPVVRVVYRERKKRIPVPGPARCRKQVVKAPVRGQVRRRERVKIVRGKVPKIVKGPGPIAAVGKRVVVGGKERNLYWYPSARVQQDQSVRLSRRRSPRVTRTEVYHERIDPRTVRIREEVVYYEPFDPRGVRIRNDHE